jgi:hypothetical protein
MIPLCVTGAERCCAGSIYADASGPGDIHVGDIHVARADHHPRAAGGATIEAAAESLRLPG